MRQTERALSGVQSTWKLCYPGSVGSQALMGIPVLQQLRDDPALKDVSRVWPFETGFAYDPALPGTPSILHVEIWPGVVNDRLDPRFAIRDEAQVHAFVRWLAERDQKQTLLELLELQGRGTTIDRQACIDEEGWILGAIPRVN